MLTAQNISYSAGKKQLLDNLSLTFEPGKINLIIGPNGAGKSTLIKVLSGMLKPSTGSIFYGINEMSVAALAKFRAVLSQNTDLAFPLTVKEIVMMGRYPHFKSNPSLADAQICDEVMRFFDVTDFAERNFLTLSGGEKQRVHFARVAAQIWQQNSKVLSYLFLDEPLAFLDIFYQIDFMNKLLALTQQKNIVVIGVVHDLNIAGKYADKLVLINNGKVLADGDKQTVLTSENIFSAYHLKPEIQSINGDVRLYY
jgi:iron complex transport system ATP-binding protein